MIDHERFEACYKRSMMESENAAFKKGERVNIVIEEIEADIHSPREEEIIDIEFDDLCSVKGNSKDNYIFKSKLDYG